MRVCAMEGDAHVSGFKMKSVEARLFGRTMHGSTAEPTSDKERFDEALAAWVSKISKTTIGHA